MLLSRLVFLLWLALPRNGDVERNTVQCALLKERDVLYHSRESSGSSHAHFSKRNHSVLADAVQIFFSACQSSQTFKLFQQNLADKNVVVVSAFWMLTTTKYTENLNDSLNLYVSWMENSTRLHAPYVFYRGARESSFLSKVRPNAEFQTLWVDLEFEHLPFAKLAAIRDVSKIWLAKIDLLVEAARMVPSAVQWLVWADAGTNEFRSQPPPTRPWPSHEFGVSYPTNTIVYAQSKTKDGCLPVGKTLMAGTVFAIHRLALPQAQDLFHATLSDCLHRAGSNSNLVFCCSDDQVILYMMSQRQPQLFFAHNGEFPNDWAGIIKAHF